MRPLSANPILLELNAFTWVSRLREKYGSKLTLASVPAEEWMRIKERGFDAVWLMGVWKRSPKARQNAFRYPELKAEFTRVLPDWTAEDVGGSAYAIFDYKLDPCLGPPGDLARVKAALNGLGLRLILDFVSNHVAFDHPWTLKHPEYLVRPTPAARREHPEWFFKPAGGVYLAYGRDPFFSPWSDTAQINAFGAEARAAMRRILERIAEVADGVRCDMAMLVLSDVFKKTWGACVTDTSAPVPGEFWDDVLAPVKRQHPDFIAIAECYWNMGQKLLSIGFDAVYDKTLYDRLIEGEPARVREHLHDAEEDQRLQVRFVENHDEPRMRTAFGSVEKALAAQAVTMTVPGVKLVHQDQEAAFKERVPVQINRFKPDPEDAAVRRATLDLWDFLKHPALHDGGRWHLLNPHEAWPGSTVHPKILCWIWTRGQDFAFVAVNFSPEPASARIRLPESCLLGPAIRLKDWADGSIYERQSAELAGEGLYVGLAPWQYHLLAPVPALD